MQLFAPESYWKLSPEDKATICNGCGSKTAKFDFVPDTIYGLNIAEACNIHDFMYYLGETIEDKKEADRVFLNNLLRIIDEKGGWLRGLRRRRAAKYYNAVAIFGGPAFWNGKNKPEELGEINRD